MTKQNSLIGNHPLSPHYLDVWLGHTDHAHSSSQCHRELIPLVPYDDPQLIEWMAHRLVNHHYTDWWIEQLKENFANLGFTQYGDYLDRNRLFPITDKTKKGNATEIILVDYIEGCRGAELTKVMKLRYNPNVDQSIKGDDTLMVEEVQGNPSRIKLYLGESKFRATPDKQMVEDISQSLGKDKNPLSMTYLITKLSEDPAKRGLAVKLSKLMIDQVRAKGDMTYVGIALSDTKTAKTIAKHLNSDNPHLVVLSLGLTDPQDFIRKIFERAEQLLTNPVTL